MRYLLRPGWAPTILVTVAMAVLPCPAADDARSAAERLGQALTASRAEQLQDVLPTQGKVQLRLQRMGSADGYFDRRQVEAIFGDFLEHGAVRSFAIARVESDGGNYALVRATAGVIDADGREVRVSLQLSLEPEAGRWIVRGIKESSR